MNLSPTPRYTVPMIQRDPRTPLSVKRAYVIGVIVVAVFSWLSCIGPILMWDKENDTISFDTIPQSRTLKATVYFAFFTIVFATLGFLFALTFLIFERWAWMTVTFRRRVKGQDIEDVDPYILQQAGHRIHQATIQRAGKIEQAGDTLDRILDRYS